MRWMHIVVMIKTEIDVSKLRYIETRWGGENHRQTLQGVKSRVEVMGREYVRKKCGE